MPLGGEFTLEENEHFNNLPVNTLMSNIQVPTNVYNRGTAGAPTFTDTSTHIWLLSSMFSFLSVDPDILNGAYMSEALNEVFIDNFQKDPTLTWQYFGSSTGFFRLYPGVCLQLPITSSQHQPFFFFFPISSHACSVKASPAELQINTWLHGPNHALLQQRTTQQTVSQVQ